MVFLAFPIRQPLQVRRLVTGAPPVPNSNHNRRKQTKAYYHERTNKGTDSSGIFGSTDDSDSKQGT